MENDISPLAVTGAVGAVGVTDPVVTTIGVVVVGLILIVPGWIAHEKSANGIWILAFRISSRRIAFSASRYLTRTLY
jgi:hypothetical protein